VRPLFLAALFATTTLGPLAACAPAPPTQTLAVPPASLYTDQGPTAQTEQFRALIGLPLRHPQALDTLVSRLYDPQSQYFHQFIGAQDFIDTFSPAAEDVKALADWLKSQGFNVERGAANQMLIEFSGTVGQFDAIFDTTIHTFKRTGDSRTQTLSSLYAVPNGVTIPHSIASLNPSLLTVDLPADASAITPASSKIDTTPPPDLTKAYVPTQISKAYGFDGLIAKGGDGSGTTIGLVVADTYREADVQSFWQTFGLTRESPEMVTVMEDPTSRVVETALDVEWAGMLAPKAKLIVYQAPDIRDTSMLYTWNEAIGRGEATVISDSFGHRETSVSKAVAEQYDASALMAAAIGITVVAATGDSGGVDAPSSCEHVTAVGGTDLVLDAQGNVQAETAWFGSGAGTSKYFDKPTFQSNIDTKSTTRGVADVALNGQEYYFTLYIGKWEEHGGSSFASPIFAAMIADAVSLRAKSGKPALGFLNPSLYDSSQNQGVFRDVTVGASGAYIAAPGWDFATGWGAPNALALAQALP
jgi:kumamolisin